MYYIYIQTAFDPKGYLTDPNSVKVNIYIYYIYINIYMYICKCIYIYYLYIQTVVDPKGYLTDLNSVKVVRLICIYTIITHNTPHTRPHYNPQNPRAPTLVHTTHYA